MVRLLIFGFLLLVSDASYAFSREAYFNEAGREMVGYLEFLSSEKKFLSSLNSNESRHFGEILKITQTLASRKGIEFVFSNDPKDFILKSGEPERSAKTTEKVDDSIYINLRKLNAAENDVSYLDVIQLLVHELGHKMGASKDQSVVDSLGLKVALYLKSYYRKGFVYLFPAFEAPRPLREFFETLSIPKSTQDKNPDPSFFYVDSLGSHRVGVHFASHLGPEGNDKFIQLNNVKMDASSGLVVEVSYSILRSLPSSSGRIFAHENSYRMKERVLLEKSFNGERLIYDDNFKVSRPQWIRNSLNFQFQVMNIEMTKEDDKSISWRIEFSGKENPKNIYLLIGIDGFNNPHACQLVESTNLRSVAECTYLIPPVTSAPYVEVAQLYVDGEVADMPEIQRVDLESFAGTRFVLSDIRAWVSARYQSGEREYLEVSTQGPDPVTTLVVRCREEQDFILNQKRLGSVSRIVEQFYLRDALPLKAQSGASSVYRVTCNSGSGYIVEVLVTDLTGYSASPPLK